MRSNEVDSKMENDGLSLPAVKQKAGTKNDDSTQTENGQSVTIIPKIDDSTQTDNEPNVTIFRTDKNGTSDKKSNGHQNGLDRGVVLNPLQFFRSRYNFKWTPTQSESKNNLKEQEMTHNHVVVSSSSDSSASAVTSPEHSSVQMFGSVPKSEEDSMSIMRKIVFGFSFLPIIMFILMFTVLLPCENPHRVLDNCCKNATNITTLDAGITALFVS